jgi:glycine dehydrogenase subunit 2
VSESLIFEKSVTGRRGVTFPKVTQSIYGLIPKKYQRQIPLPLPEISENDLMRHYTRLSSQTYGVDTGFYPLGSCTMKYNPKIHEEVARYAGFANIHPLQQVKTVQGSLKLLYELQQFLSEISGMDQVSLTPSAGAQGELVGMLMVRAYHCNHGRLGSRRTKVIIPDSAHGTNPASATLAGFTIQTVKTNADGGIDTDDLARVVNDQTAAMMLTNPNTLGLFEKEIGTISKIIHEAGALLYLDGANLNALLGLSRPGDMGFDIVHFNLHKTFSTPHGGGGPGAGPVGVKRHLIPYLPYPLIEKNNKGAVPCEEYRFEKRRRKSVGRVHGFYGNFGILLRAYTYIRRLGAEGLSAISRNTIINANYLKEQLKDSFPVPYNRPCMHEFVVTAKKFKSQDVHAWDIAKRLIDYGFYPPTVNFPLIVEEALMIEVPESESKETIDRFVFAMRAICDEIEKEPKKVTGAPHTRPIKRVDEVFAARKLNVRYKSS